MVKFWQHYIEVVKLFFFIAGDTIQGLLDELRKATKEMKEADCSTTSVESGCELFRRFITFAALDLPVKSINLFFKNSFLAIYFFIPV